MTEMLIVGGTGGTGSWFASYFKNHGFDVSVWGLSGRFDVAERLGVKYARDLPGAVQESDIVLISVPIDKTVDMIREVAPLMKAGSLLMDVTSLKTKPVEAMLEHAPEDVELLGTHPMFGPTMPVIKGQTVILVPVRCATWLSRISGIFEGDGARVELLDPLEHDKIMAVIQALTHFAYISIGAALTDLGFDLVRSKRYMSPVYEIMIDFVGRILDQKPDLYASIQANPEAKRIRDVYIKQCIELAESVDQSDRERFIETMQRAALHFGDTEGAMDRSDRLINLKIEEDQKKSAGFGMRPGQN